MRIELLPTALSLLLGSISAESSPETCARQTGVTVILSDAHRVLPVSMPVINRALEEEFRQVGIDVLATQEEDDNLERVAVRAVIIPHDGESWGSDGKRLAQVSSATRNGPSPVFVFYPAVERTLGKPANARMVLGQHPHEADFTRGLARIIAHEVIHVLLPSKTHAATRVFSEKLTRRYLLGKELALDSDTHAALSERLCTPM